MPAPHLRQITVLAGPTASGKSRLAMDWALHTGALIVNADSMQVYRDLAILTARPSRDDMERVPHALYGYVDGATPYSVALWLEDVAELIAGEPVARPMLFVGGTGLYLEALTKGLSPVPPVPQEVRDHWRARGLAEAAPDLHRELKERDPLLAAELRPSDTQRIIRGIEVWEGTGRSLRDWRAETSPPLAPHAEIQLLMPERTELRRRIANRFEAMMDNGALQEVTALASRGLDRSLPIMKAIGVPPLTAYLEGRGTLQQAVQTSITDSQQYAKRQSTYLRNRLGHRSSPSLLSTSS